MPNEFEEVGQRLRAYRLGRNLTAEDVAQQLGISRAAVYRLEKGEIVKIQILGALPWSALSARRISSASCGWA